MFRDMESAFGGQTTNTTFGGGGFTSGASASPFGQNTFGLVSSIPTATAAGTPIKFIPVTDTDETVRGGVTQTINIRLLCITCMEEYQGKSLEELQLADYMANCKGPQPASQQAGFFDFATQSAPFGSSANTSLFPDKPFCAGTTSMGIGGGGFTSGATASPFGQNVFGFGCGTGAFGSTNQQAGSLFGKPTGFGAVTAATASGTCLNLGQSLFGQTNKPGSLFETSSGMFGSGDTFGGSTNFGVGSGLGTSLNLGGNPLLGGSGTVSSTNQQENFFVHEQILTRDSMPFEDTPLFRNILPAHGKTNDLKPSTHVFQKTPPSSTQSKGTLRGNIKLKVRPLPGYLWTKVLSVQPSTPKDEGGSSKHSTDTEAIRELSQTCSLLHSQVEQLQSSMQSMMQCMSMFCQPPSAPQPQLKSRATSTQTDNIVLATHQEDGVPLPYQHISVSRTRRLSLPILQQARTLDAAAPQELRQLSTSLVDSDLRTLASEEVATGGRSDCRTSTLTPKDITNDCATLADLASELTKVEIKGDIMSNNGNTSTEDRERVCAAENEPRQNIVSEKNTSDTIIKKEPPTPVSSPIKSN